MLPIVFRDLLLFSLAIAGLALPAWSWLRWAQGTERLALSVAAALLIAYLAVFGLYLAAVPLRWFWLLPAVGLVHAIIRPAGIAGWWRDLAVRGLIGRWLLLSLWCLGWHGLIVSYSGGGWAGDWVEHYDRTQFFLQHWPTGHLFLGLYPVPARPPLVNLVTAGLMAQTGGGFVHYQVITTLLSCLVLLPLIVLLRRWRDDARAESTLLLLLMVCPLFVQNATFPWTKLASAFFVLLAVTQLSPSAGTPTRARLIAGAVLLAGGMLAHYSAGPWICALGAAGAWLHRHRWREREFQPSVLLAALAAGLLCATWLGWALAVYGPATTFTANTAVGLAPAGTLTERTVRAASNLWFTLSPIVTNADVPPQSSPLGQLRDYWFMLYQLKLPPAFGFVSGALLLLGLIRFKPTGEAKYWLIAAPLVVLLGTATHAQADLHGLTHIALQPLVLLGLVWLAAQAGRLPRWLGLIWLGGLVFDFCAGILLNFAVQSFWFECWLHPNQAVAQYISTYSLAARNNWLGKSGLQLTFLADVIAPGICLALLTIVGATVLALHLRTPRQSQTVAAPKA